MHITDTMRSAAITALRTALHRPEHPCIVVDGYVRCNGHTIAIDPLITAIVTAAAPRFDGTVPQQEQLAVQQTFVLGKRRFGAHDLLTCAHDLYWAEVNHRRTT